MLSQSESKGHVADADTDAFISSSVCSQISNSSAHKSTKCKILLYKISCTSQLHVANVILW